MPCFLHCERKWGSQNGVMVEVGGHEGRGPEVRGFRVHYNIKVVCRVEEKLNVLWNRMVGVNAT